ncbi:AMID-like mitochondrial oxidoreductase [Talaromyces pinophilus]|uniref:AMID-like mitochondrial oxidoreductase n=1 Tax=Talaromyces pinophilus TaxID=128442 RepID=A0A510NVX9_TALPI|nr:AMID-like mitochondrial oxidoreductase [Talaromyces pinophilus]
MPDLTNQQIYISASLVALPLFVLWSWRQRRLNIEAAEMAQAPTKTVVIIGGSFAGIGVAHGLLKEVPSAKVVLVNPSEDLYFNVASPRLTTRPNDIPREKYIYPIAPVFHKHANAKKNFEFVLGKATSIDLQGKNVIVQVNSGSSKTLAYDYVVIASGSTSNATTGTNSLQVPFKQSGSGKIEAELKAAQEAIKAAKSVIIGGAGAVGVEFAGEIAEAYPGVEVTLLTNSDNVLFGLREPTRQKAAKILKQKGVKILTDKTVTSASKDAGKWSVVTADDQTLTADIYVSTTGVLPNNEFIPASLLNNNGWVEVDNHFVSKTDPSVYAVGDITQYSARLLSRVSGQVSVLISNLKADITGKGKRAAYKDDPSRMVVMPMGKSTGTGQIGSFTPPGFMVSFVKGKDYFTGSAKKFISG